MIEEIGKYKVIRELGKGATSAVYLAKDPFKDHLVAIKLVKSGDESKLSRRYQKLFIAESALAGKLHHPHIVAIYDAVIEKNQSYMVMEYVDGETLEKYCKLDKLMAYQRTVQVIFKCCLALDYAFREGVIHRDIKPANIMVLNDGLVKITDFGIARMRNNEVKTMTGMILGSPKYMSPEQVSGKRADTRSDIFSLGVVLYEMVTGKRPFDAESLQGICQKVMSATPLPPSQINGSLPAGLNELVASCLEKDPGRRRNSAEDLALDLYPFARRRAEPQVSTGNATMATGSLRNRATRFLRSA